MNRDKLKLIEKKEGIKRKQVSCFVAEKYLELLKEANVGFTDYVNLCLEETFGKIRAGEEIANNTRKTN